MALVLSVFEQGFIFAILALGVYITYKILDFPDLTVDSSFPLGAVVCAVMIKAGINPWLSLPVAFIVGGLAGLVTGIIHVKFKVRDLLSGIITMTILYSINLHIANGQANVPLFSDNNIFTISPFKNVLEKVGLGDYNIVLIVLFLALICKIIMDLYLKTKSGFLLRAVGNNENVVTSLAKDKGNVKIVGLVIANALVALSGAIMCQHQRYFDISMGTGTIVIGLASVIIGINVFSRLSFLKATSTVVIGSIIYKACVATAISMGMKPIDMKLITGVLFLAILVISSFRNGGASND